MHKTDSKIIAGIRDRLDRPVVLIGLMGVGKTRIGRSLAGAVGMPFVDSDEEIERAAGMPVADIFEKFGEPYFREGERRVIGRLLDGGVQVIATGGGAIMTPETAERIWRDAISIWVRAEMPVMLERTARSGRRPLLRSGNPEEILSALAEKRYPVYEKANIVLDSRDGPSEVILNQALVALHSYLFRR